MHTEGCGLPDAIAKNDPYFTLEDDRCPVCAEIDRELRARAKQEHEAEKDLPESAARAADGRTTRIRLLRPDEIAALPKKT